MKKYTLILFLLLSWCARSQQWVTLDTADLNLPLMATTYIEVDKNDNSIWFGGLYHLHHLFEGVVDVDIKYNLDSGPADLNTVNDIAIHNSILYGLDDMEGLFKYDSGVFTILGNLMAEGYTITPDDQDTLWVGTSSFYGYGFFGYFDGNYDLLTTGTSPGIYSNNVYNIMEDSQNRKWITYWTSTSGWGYSLCKNNVWNFFHIGNTEIPTQHVKKIVESPTNTVWAVTRFGLARFDEILEDWVVYNQQNTNMPGEWIEDVQFDSQGRLWALFKDTALAYTTNYTDWTIFNEFNSPLTVGNMKSFTIDLLDQVWVGDLYKLHVLTLGTFNNWLATEEIESSFNDSKINIFPNPANSQITINGFSENSEIEILNMQGKTVYKNQTANLSDEMLMKSDSKTTIDVSQFERGIYIVRVNSADGVITQKIVLQ